MALIIICFRLLVYRLSLYDLLTGISNWRLIWNVSFPFLSYLIFMSLCRIFQQPVLYSLYSLVIFYYVLQHLYFRCLQIFFKGLSHVAVWAVIFFFYHIFFIIFFLFFWSPCVFLLVFSSFMNELKFPFCYWFMKYYPCPLGATIKKVVDSDRL